MNDAALDRTDLDDETVIFTGHIPIEPLGAVVCVNSYLLRSREPLLIDTGARAWTEEMMQELHQAIPLDELRWVWLTHTDPDHTGSLDAVLAAAPRARLVTTFLGMAKLMLFGFATDRAHLLNPGQRLDLGDRTLLAFKPPSFDAPETTGVLDESTGTLFSADCFGALLPAKATDATALAPEVLREGLITWATIDAPWLDRVDRRDFRLTLDAVRAFGSEMVLSSHLPPAPGMLEVLLDHLEEASWALPFVGPDQSEIERQLQQGVETVATL